MDKAIILIVDDDEQVRSMLKKFLGRTGYEVQEARNGKEALQIHNSQPADLIIIDILMPDKDGIETIVELRRIHQDVKIIAISGGGQIMGMDFLTVAEMLGADSTLAKPFTVEEILDRVRAMLQA
jgi:DNA-binding response OmpR family regulator